LVFDLITGERYMRPNIDKMRKDGWLTWDELPEHYQETFAAQKPPETKRRHWFKVELVHDPKFDWVLKKWEPRIEEVSDDPIRDYT
jgi:hypothetical protein